MGGARCWQRTESLASCGSSTSCSKSVRHRTCVSGINCRGINPHNQQQHQHPRLALSSLSLAPPTDATPVCACGCVEAHLVALVVDEREEEVGRGQIARAELPVSANGRLCRHEAFTGRHSTENNVHGLLTDQSPRHDRREWWSTLSIWLPRTPASSPLVARSPTAQAL